MEHLDEEPQEVYGSVDGAEADVIALRRRRLVILLHLRVLRALEFVEQLRPQHQVEILTHS